MTPRTTPRTPPVDVAHATARYAAGLTLKEVAAELDVSWRVLQRVLRQHGVALRAPGRIPVDLDPAAIAGRYQAGESIRGLAAELGVHHNRLRATLTAAGVTDIPRGRRPETTTPPAS